MGEEARHSAHVQLIDGCRALEDYYSSNKTGFEMQMTGAALPPSL